MTQVSTVEIPSVATIVPEMAPEKKSLFKRMLTRDFLQAAAMSAAVTTSLKLAVSMTGAGAVVTGVTVGVGKTIYDVGRDRKQLIEMFNKVAADNGKWAASRKIALNVGGRLALNTGGGLLGALGVDAVLDLARDYIPGAATAFDATRDFCAPLYESFKASEVGSKIAGGLSHATGLVRSGWESIKNTFSGLKIPFLGSAPDVPDVKVPEVKTSGHDATLTAEPAPLPQRSYTVKSGDSLWKIARENNIDWDAMKAANPDYANGEKIIAGKTILNLPDPDAPKPVAQAPVTKPEVTEAPKATAPINAAMPIDTHIVKPTQTLSFIAAERKISLKNLIEFNPQLTDPDNITEGQKINLRPDHNAAASSVKPSAKVDDVPLKTQVSHVPPESKVADTCTLEIKKLESGGVGLESHGCEKAHEKMMKPGQIMDIIIKDEGDIVTNKHPYVSWDGKGDATKHSVLTGYMNALFELLNANVASEAPVADYSIDGANKESGIYNSTGSNNPIDIKGANNPINATGANNIYNANGDRYKLASYMDPVP